MKKTITKIFALALIVLAIVSCTKTQVGAKGDTGATGATGAQGIQGNTGASGTNGTNGTNGVANIQSFTFYNQGFAYVAANNDYENFSTVSAITATVMSSGMVAVYMQPTTASNAWISLPCTISGNSVNVIWAIGGLLIDSPNALSGLWNVRVVVIPPAFKIKNPNVNWNSYDEVKVKFNLQD